MRGKWDVDYWRECHSPARVRIPTFFYPRRFISLYIWRHCYRVVVLLSAALAVITTTVTSDRHENSRYDHRIYFIINYCPSLLIIVVIFLNNVHFKMIDKLFGTCLCYCFTNAKPLNYYRCLLSFVKVRNIKLILNFYQSLFIFEKKK